MCETQEQRNRVLIELNLFKDHGMIIVLQFLKYPVDVCKEHNIVLGVGRGSSASELLLIPFRRT